MNNARFIIQVSKGLIRDQTARRTLMFYNIAILLGLVFVGFVFLWSWLRAHPLLFLGYWGLCAWLTMLSALLALYDIASVRLDAKRARRELEEELRTGKTRTPHDPDAP